MSLVYAQVVKYLLEYAARALAARLGMQVVAGRAQQAAVPDPAQTPDSAFDLTAPAAEPELSEEERLNRQPFYEQGRAEGRREGELEERAREQERRQVEESRDPEVLARDEERRREDFFREEAERKREEQERQFREQDAEKQRDMAEEARLDKERHASEAAERKEEHDKENREESEHRQAELDRQERDKAEHERAEREARERERQEEERRREAECEKVKADVKAFDTRLRTNELARLADFQNERRGTLLQYGDETGRRIDLFQKEQEAQFARQRADLTEQQEKRWLAAEGRIDTAYHSGGSSVDPRLIAEREKAELASHPLEWKIERQVRAEEDKTLVREQAERSATEKERIARELKAEETRIRDERDAQLDTTEAARRAAFKEAEARAWKEEQDLRRRENEQLERVQGWAREGLRNRFAGDADKLEEMQQKQDKVLEQQQKELAESQQKRWDEAQQKLAEEHQMRLAAEAERQRQEAERQRQEALQRAAMQRQSLF
jgi:hypothetical protein